jgi:hypothetical protein
MALRNTNTLIQLTNPSTTKKYQTREQDNAEFINIHSTIAVDHILDKQGVAYVKNLGTYAIHQTQ